MNGAAFKICIRLLGNTALIYVEAIDRRSEDMPFMRP
jgi:hypothetical protein